MAERKRRSPESKALEALAVSDRKIISIEKRLTKARTDVADLMTELAAVKAEREYLAANPYLPENASEAIDTVADDEPDENEDPMGNAGA
jgi:hypothetical protein